MFDKEIGLLTFSFFLPGFPKGGKLEVEGPLSCFSLIINYFFLHPSLLHHGKCPLLFLLI